jgi:hypothetical protein
MKQNFTREKILGAVTSGCDGLGVDKDFRLGDNFAMQPGL